MASDPFQRFKDEISDGLRQVLDDLEVDAPIILDKSPAGMGDLAFPCFTLAKQLRKSPDVIAKELASKIQPGGLIEKVSSSSGYVNFHVKFDGLAQGAIVDALTKKEKFGSGEGRSNRILLEHTSVNPTGPIHVGRETHQRLIDIDAAHTRTATQSRIEYLQFLHHILLSLEHDRFQRAFLSA